MVACVIENVRMRRSDISDRTRQVDSRRRSCNGGGLENEFSMRQCGGWKKEVREMEDTVW